MTWNVVMKSIRLRVEHRIPYLEYWFFYYQQKREKNLFQVEPTVLNFVQIK